MNNIDLDVLVKENHDAMKNGRYNWQDNEVRAVYALIYHFLKTVQCPQNEMEDMAQEMGLCFFANVVPAFDPNKGIKISSFAFRAFKNKYIIIKRKKEVACISLESRVSEDFRLEDVICDKSYLDADISEVKRQIIDRFIELNENNDIVLKLENGQEIIPINNHNILSYIDHNDVASYKPIKYIMRHKVNKPKYKIKTKSGKELILTADHSVMVIRNNELISIKTKDIDMKTDKLITVNEHK